MKGIIFVELLLMAESVVGEEAVDEVLDSLDLPNFGAYTSVGNYPCSELMTLCAAFSKATNIPDATLQTTFGKWIFSKFAENYGIFFEDKNNAFEMLESIDGEVHVEVRKLYPEAELPKFITKRVDENVLQMRYFSDRPLVDFCLGMIQACLEHFGEKAEIERTNIKIENKFGGEFNIRLLGDAA